MANIGIGIAAGLVGGLIGGPAGAGFAWSWAAGGFALGSMVGNMLLAPSVPNQVSEGQRAQSLLVQSSGYGGTIPVIYGRMRTSGNIIWARPLDEVREEQATQSGGGGKVGGGASSTQVYYRYYATFAVAICKGPISGVIKIFADSKLIFNIDTTDSATIAAGNRIPVTFHLGDETQIPDTTIQSFDGVGNVPAYRGLAYAVFNHFPLADYGNRIPNLTFEVACAVGADSRMALLLPFDPATQFNDKSNFRHPMTASNAAILSTGGGIGGSAAYFNGSASITTPSDSSFDLNSTDFTIDFWARQGASSNGVMFQFGNNLDNRFYLQIFAGKLRIGFATAGVYTVYDAAPALTNNTWYHFAVTRRSGTWRVYVNGVLYIIVASYPIPAYTGAVCIGSDTPYSGGSSPFKGFIDEFRIARYALWTSDFTPPASGIGGGLPAAISPYKLNLNCDGQGGDTTVVDQTEYHHNGTGTNGAMITNLTKFMGTGSVAVLNSTSRVTIPASTDFNLSNTISWEISFAASLGAHDGTHDYILLSTGGNNYHQGGWRIYVTKNISGEYRLRFSHSSGILVLDYLFDYAPNWGEMRISFNDQDGKVRLYIGNTLAVTVDSPWPIINSSRSLTIGAEIPEGGADDNDQTMTSPFWIDEVVINIGGSVNTGATVGASSTPTVTPTSSQLTALQVKGEYISNIIKDICQMAGLSLDDIDTTRISVAEDRLLPGFIMNSQSSARQYLEILTGAFSLDVAESAIKLYFMSRHDLVISGTVSTIPSDDLAARPAQSGGSDQLPDPLEITTTQEVEVPKELTVKCLDPSRDYWPVSQRASRQVTNSIQKAEINLPMALSPDLAALVAIRNLIAVWVERKRYKFSIPIKYARLDVGDIVQIDHNSQSHFVRISKITFNNGLFDMEGVGQDIFGTNISGSGLVTGPVAGDVGMVAATAVTGAVPPPAQQAIQYPVVSTPILIDSNLILDSHDGPGYYALIDQGQAGGYWPSGVILKSSDNSYLSLIGFSASASLGVALTALADGIATIFDMANSVTIKMTTGQLYSDTEINVLNGANIGILGNEIIQWKTATLTATGTYVLSGLLRGRRGTEWATVSHAAGERFVLYAPSSFQRAAGMSEEIGLERFYKALTTGLNLADQPYYNFTNSAKGLKPYSPCHIKATRDGSNNITLTWIRRTRKGGGWRDYVDAALSEAAELYDVEVKSGSTVLRTLSGLSSPTAGYTAAQQTADGLTPGDPVTVNIYQISADVGRGYAGAAVV